MQQNNIFKQSRIMRSLDHFYLSVGILHELSQDLFPEVGSKPYRETVLILDQQPDIPAPAMLPANWPVAVVRAYTEIHVEKDSVIRYHPEAVGVNQDSVGYAEGVAMDQLGLRAYCQHLAKARKGLTLAGGYLLMAESEQTSLVPMLGNPDDFTGIEYMLEQLPKGMLDAFYRRQVSENYAQAALSEDLHESVENMGGRTGRFHNWELANALVATACMSWIQFQKVDLNKPAEEKARGQTEFVQTMEDIGGLAKAREAASPYGEAYTTTPSGPTEVEVGITDLQDQIHLPVEDGVLGRVLAKSGEEASPEQQAAQEAFDELSPTEKAAKALGVDPGVLEELAQSKQDLMASGAMKVTDVALNLYEKLGVHVKRSNGITLRTSTVSENSLAGIVAYLRNLIEAPFALEYAPLEKLVLATDTDFNELTYAVPELAKAEPKDVAEAFLLALIYLIDNSNMKVSALAPQRYDELEESRFTPFLEPIGDLSDEEAHEVLSTAHLDAAALALFKAEQAE